MTKKTKINEIDKLMKSAEWIDLSPLIENDMPRWPTHPPVMISRAMTHDHDGVLCQNISMPEHAGSHVDAPHHIHKDQPENTIEKMPVNYLYGSCKVVHLEGLELKAGETANAQNVLDWEKKSGETIGEDDIVIINFGWVKKHWKKNKDWSYFATNQPGLTKDAAELFRARKIRILGSDTAACGTPLVDGKSLNTESKPLGCWVHDTILRAGIPLIECLNNLEKLPDACYFTAAPLKLNAGSGSPIRAAALVFSD